MGAWRLAEARVGVAKQARVGRQLAQCADDEKRSRAAIVAIVRRCAFSIAFAFERVRSCCACCVTQCRQSKLALIQYIASARSAASRSAAELLPHVFPFK
tara:strand:+ start:144 stop:443 length:300 start_codon:yes stop_codon:yes gene_type:complete